MQAIETRYLGPTDHHGSRVKALCEAGQIILPFDYAATLDDAHDAAARALIVKLGWNDGRGRWYRGSVPKSRGYVYVCTYRTEGLKLPSRKRVRR